MADERLSRIGREILFTSFIGGRTSASEPWVIERVAGSLEEIDAHAGDFLFREGDPADYIYFMSEGRVLLTRSDGPDWVYDGKWVVGTTDHLIGRPRLRTAKLETDARIFRMRGDDWLEIMEDSFDLTSSALVGWARGAVVLYARLGADFTRAFGEDYTRSSVAPARRANRGGSDAVTLVGRAVLLSEMPLLHGASVQALTELAGAMKSRRLTEGEALLERGAPRDRLFVVLSGTIEARREEPHATGRFGPGSIAGGAISLGDLSAEWTLAATEPATVLSLSIEDWFNEMEEHPAMARTAMGALAEEREHMYDELARDAPLVLR